MRATDLSLTRVNIKVIFHKIIEICTISAYVKKKTTDLSMLDSNCHMGPPMNRQTDTSEKITFPQLHWQAVKMKNFEHSGRDGGFFLYDPHKSAMDRSQLINSLLKMLSKKDLSHRKACVNIIYMAD